jgi:murein DD-endopeptidase MepM/ murein hydrolase activator NlpD
MAELDFNTLYNQLQSEIQGLFSSKQKFNAPSAAPGTSEPSQNVIPSSGSFTLPIHGAWHNLGGWAPSQARYDDLAKNPKATTGRGHFGVDMGAPAGTPVYAIGKGVVTSVGTDPMGGNIVGVTHDNNVWSYYAHLSTAKVQKGDKVDQNTVVGTVGNTGNPGNPKDPFVTQEGGRTWPHLHFGIKEHGSWVDPAKYFTLPKYDADYAKNPSKYQSFWLSDQAKQEAQAFNMKSHVADRRVAFSNEVKTLLKLASVYYKLSVDPG